MKIAWLAPAGGRIATVASEVAAALSQANDLQRWAWDAAGPAEALDRLDVAVHHLGPAVTPAPVPALAGRHAGLIVLHDTALHDLFAALPAARQADPRLSYPLLERALAHAVGIVAHTDWQYERIRSASDAPVLKLFEPACAADAAFGAAGPERGGERLAVAAGPLRPGAGIEALVEILGRRSELARRLRVTIGDAIDEGNPLLSAHAAALRGRIAELGLSGSVAVGTDGEPQRPDLVVDLRMPGPAATLPDLRLGAAEGLRAAVARRLAAGTPVVAWSSPLLADVPRGALVSLPPGDAGALEAVLLELVRDPARRAQVAAEAARAAGQLTPRRYADELSGFLEEELPRHVPRSACARAGRELGVIDAAPRPGSFDLVGDELAVMFP
jgi:glycosyltransferase involved in cell wall biosynthesis